MRVVVVDQKPDRVADHVDHRSDGLHAALRRSRCVEDEAGTDRAGCRPRQPTQRVDQPHGFGKAGSLAVQNLPGSLRRYVTGPEAGSAGGDDQPVESRRQPPQLACHCVRPVGHHGSLHDPPARLAQIRFQRRLRCGPRGCRRPLRPTPSAPWPRGRPPRRHLPRSKPYRRRRQQNMAMPSKSAPGSMIAPLPWPCQVPPGGGRISSRSSSEARAATERVSAAVSVQTL